MRGLERNGEGQVCAGRWWFWEIAIVREEGETYHLDGELRAVRNFVGECACD